MALAEALIGVGGSLLGGLLGGSKKVRAQDNAYGHVKGIMRAAEEFGFNPLTLLGTVGASGGQPAQSYMGAALADAGMLLADGLAKSKSLGRLERAERLNAKLTQRVNDLTLRPPVPGVYGSLQSGGSGNGAVSSRVVPVGAPDVRSGAAPCLS